MYCDYFYLTNIVHHYAPLLNHVRPCLHGVQ